MSSAEKLEENKALLLNLSDAEESAAIMTGFQSAETLMKGIKGRNDSFMPFGDSEIGKAVTAMTDTLARAQETFANDTSMPGKLLGHCCVIQCLYRELEAGETRQILITKCQKTFQQQVLRKVRSSHDNGSRPGVSAQVRRASLKERKCSSERGEFEGQIRQRALLPQLWSGT